MYRVTRYWFILDLDITQACLGGVVVTLTDHQLERESLNLSQPNPKSEK